MKTSESYLLLLGSETESLFFTLIHPFYDIARSVMMGGLFGFTISLVLRTLTEEDKILTFSLGMLVLALGISLWIELDMLVVAMAMGSTLVNHSPQKSKQVFAIVAKFTPPIYVLFFVLIGAKLAFSQINVTVLILGGLYLFGRTVGKMVGATFGAKISKAPVTVQKYLAYCLFSQAGVAIGLSILASHRFSGEVGDTIVAIITATTFIVQIVGPAATKIAVTQAEEVGLNITEEDLLRKSKAKDVLDEAYPFLQEETPVSKILKIFSENQNLYYAVTDEHKNLKGIVGVDSIKDTFMTNELNDFLVAHDIMDPVMFQTDPETSVLEVKEIFNREHVEFIPVVGEDNKALGVLETRDIDQLIKKQIIEMHQKAEAME